MTPRLKRLPISMAIRRAMSAGYTRETFRADLLAGVVVGIVALPLSMALAIAVGVPPQHGLYTAIIAGAVTALTGGSKFQITGPTAAFVVILAPIVNRFGLNGLLTAGLMAGVMLVGMGLAGLGRFITFIPHPVTTGFTAGIATVIATLQIKDVFGLHVVHMPDEYLGKVHALWLARSSASWQEFVVAITTLGLLIGIPRVLRKIPAPLVAIASVSVVVTVLARFVPGFHVATIGTRFHALVGGHEIAGIPPLPPTPMLPWGPNGISLATFRELGSAAFAIAMLGAIESLLSAVVADGMTGKRHDPNAELVGQGIGNIIAPFFGGIAATGALARTATNVRAGGRTPISAVVHSAVVLLSILVLAPAVAYIPMASLAGLLLLVAWNMSEVRHAIHTVRVAPRSDVFVLLTCFVLTVVFDMVVAVSTGVMLAALLFMRRMAEMTQSRLLLENENESTHILPHGVALYEINGPLFFGAAQNAVSSLEAIGANVRILVLGLGHVPVIDSTGMVALESMIARLQQAKVFVIIAGPLPEPRKMFEKVQLELHMKHVMFTSTLDQALLVARDLVLLNPEWKDMESAFAEAASEK
ncbi:MAG: C4-dicarboxylic acid transporter DauA [Deltaproteobacteria bacterium]